MKAKEFLIENTIEQVKNNISSILSAAQKVYDDWDESEVDTYAGGGICHLIADAICEVMWNNDIECTTISCNFEQHVYVAVKVEDGIYSIDIPYSIYETGGGYSWKKLPNVKFDKNDVVFYKMSSDPEEFDELSLYENSELFEKRKRKTKKSKKTNLRKYYYGGFGYYGLPNSSDSSSDMSGADGGGGGESINKNLKITKNYDYSPIEQLRKQELKKRSFNKNVADEILAEDQLENTVNHFCNWVCSKLKISNIPNVKLSNDTEEAQKNHHTGGYVPDSNEIWVYAKNRNLVDILRTIAHELTHVKQNELDMIEMGDSFPGSSIELLADMMSGKLIKIYGKKFNHIFQ